VVGSGTLEAQVSTADGVGSITPAITGSGILLAPVSTVDGAASVTPVVTGSGILLASVSTVQGAAEAFTPYVYMEGGEVYDYMGPDDIYVIGELQPE
jgi:hypothetical protein